MDVELEEKVKKIWQDLESRRYHSGEDKIARSDWLKKVREYEAAVNSPTRALAIASANSDEIEKLALLDNLTELYNYRTFLKELKAEFNRATRYGHAVSLCMLAIDNFEVMREQFGELTGESILRLFGNVIRGAVRDLDIPAKYNYQTFVVVLPQTPPANAALVAERLRQRIGNQAIAHNWQNFSVTASIGVAAFPIHASAHDELIARCFEALDHAIGRGGDRVFCA